MYRTDLPLREPLMAAHQAAWQAIANPGAFWTGSERLAIVAASRNAAGCRLCARRKAALSPGAELGEHDHAGHLDAAAVEVIHRVRSDPARLTRRWFDEVMRAGLTPEAYLELIGVMNTALIIDGFAFGLGLDPTPLPRPADGAPSGEVSDAVVDVGAWVPVADVEVRDNPAGLPSAPMIGRAMGRVPSAVRLFISVVRAHYQLHDYDVALSRPQIELLAAKVSAVNQCFY